MNQHQRINQRINPAILLKAFVLTYAVWVLIPIIARLIIDSPTERWFWKDLSMAIGGGGLICSFYFLTVKINWYTIGVTILGALSICTVLSDYDYIDKYDTVFIAMKIAISLIIIIGIFISLFINKRGT